MIYLTRAYYASSIKEFLQKDNCTIFGEIVGNDQFASDDLQKNAWKEEIKILKNTLPSFSNGYLLFEYTIPRVGKRIDAIVLLPNIIFLLEFKVGATTYPHYAMEQVVDYALDLHDFHKESHNKLLSPILVCTNAPYKQTPIEFLQESILEPCCCDTKNLKQCMETLYNKYGLITHSPFCPLNWVNSIYMPTPTIIEAAQALYTGHKVEDISRSDASAKNLNQTTKAIHDIINRSKQTNTKSICFVTGVPGAGKTLAGLNIAIERQKVDEQEHAVFLSGNGPLVDVLQEALARDDEQRNGTKKSVALRKAREFIQIIHHFRDDAISVNTPPIEHVAIFDEAQRAWDEANLSDFMKRKKGVPDFHMSEPEFLISILNRHKGWAVIVCLVGGGQEINKGESAGIHGWLSAIRNKYKDWNIYLSNEITDEEYTKGIPLEEMTEGLSLQFIHDLHLSVSLRSFRNENVSKFVKALLDIKQDTARNLYNEIQNDYPICMTRNLETAKHWIKQKAKGSQRYGLIASSGAKRLRQYGIWVQSKIDPPIWFLNDKQDIRSSYFLEETATEFDIQGLELDWTIVCWDANLRIENSQLAFYNLKGTKWNKVLKEQNQIYLKNAYRVLLTRARQGFIIFIPYGDADDPTMSPTFYDSIYTYLQSIGIQELI